MAAAATTTSTTILATAGAVPFMNEKGELSMQKVKVQRYITGKRPDFAPEYSSESEEETDDFINQKKQAVEDIAPKTEIHIDDRRLRRLQEREEVDDEEEEDRILRHQRLREPEILEQEDDEEDEDEQKRRRHDSSDEDEIDEEDAMRRRAEMRARAKLREQEEELLKKEEDESGESENSEYEEYSESEEEDTGPRLKPVFVRKRDRITIHEREREEQKVKDAEVDRKKLAEERRVYSRRLVEKAAKEMWDEERGIKDEMDKVVSEDEENDEQEYEMWKLRELKRIKRDREERERLIRETAELERLHSMTEEERRLELKNNPRIITNLAPKGKYKFMQKYFHRGAFYLDEEQTVYKRDFAAPTLEDHFDKTILPKVMQVKDFGFAGRTKYTHLVDQDTTEWESPWISDTAQNLKFHTNKAGGMKQVFEKPSSKKKPQTQS